jgi:hypothetical protein
MTLLAFPAANVVKRFLVGSFPYQLEIVVITREEVHRRVLPWRLLALSAK